MTSEIKATLVPIDISLSVIVSQDEYIRVIVHNLHVCSSNRLHDKKISSVMMNYKTFECNIKYTDFYSKFLNFIFDKNKVVNSLRTL